MANWAIAVGINNYDNLQPLNYAKGDAEAMRDWFQQEAKFEEVFLFTEDSPPIPAKPSPILTQPTFARLQRFLDVQFQQPMLKAGDNLWFFFAGHGIRAADGDYLMLLDSNPGSVQSTAISVNYVTERLRRCGADNVVLFLDACRNEGSRDGLGIGNDFHQGVITFYSCSPNQKSYEIEDLQHGAFTKVLLEGLRIQGEGNCATVERLEQHLRYGVPQINRQYSKPLQSPYAKAEPAGKSHLILLPKSATLDDIAVLREDALHAEVEGDLPLAEQLWIRVLALSSSDPKALTALKRIWTKQPSSIAPSAIDPAVYSHPEKGSRSQSKDRNNGFIEDLGNDVKLEMVGIPGGTFIMGAPKSEEGSSDDERPQHQVEIQPFLMGKYPITEDQWLVVAKLPKVEIELTINPSHFKGNNRPVENVSWYDAVEFCARLSKKTGRSYRLPSEAEWEYACRAGTETPFYFGVTITTNQANYNGNYTYGNSPKEEYRGKTTDVGIFPANAFGLHDLHGNVWEWCADPWHDNYDKAPRDGRVWDEKDNDNRYQSYLDLGKKVKNDNYFRVLRGGSWVYHLMYCRSARRAWRNPGSGGSGNGFRAVCSVM